MKLNNEEPIEAAGSKPTYKKASLVLEVKEIRKRIPSKEELAWEVSELNNCLAKSGSSSKGDPKAI